MFLEWTVTEAPPSSLKLTHAHKGHTFHIGINKPKATPRFLELTGLDAIPSLLRQTGTEATPPFLGLTCTEITFTFLQQHSK